MSYKFSQSVLHAVPNALNLQYQFVKEVANGGVVATDKYADDKEVLIEALPFTSRPDVMAMMDFQSAIYDLKFNPRPNEPAIIEAKDDSYNERPMLYIIQEYNRDNPEVQNKTVADILNKHLASWLVSSSNSAAPSPNSDKAPSAPAAATNEENQFLTQDDTNTAQPHWAPVEEVAPLPPTEIASEQITLKAQDEAAASTPMVAVMARLMAEAKATMATQAQASSASDTVPVGISAEQAARLQDLAADFTIWSTRTAATSEAATWEKRFDEATSFNERANILEEWNQKYGKDAHFSESTKIANDDINDGGASDIIMKNFIGDTQSSSSAGVMGRGQRHDKASSLAVALIILIFLLIIMEKCQ